MKYFQETSLYDRRVGSAIGIRDNILAYQYVFLIERIDGQINFIDGRDYYLSKIMTKKEAVEALKEAIKWIENDEKI